MKKFSTIALLIAVAFPVVASSQASAQEAARAAKAGKCTFLPDAPDKHVVVKGDTLWGISGKFLSNPWCWPEVWGMNRDEIRNPHWIYPNQIVYFDRINGRLRLGNNVGDGSITDSGRLQPQIRTENTGRNAITAIPSNLIEPFLSQPLVIEKDTLLTAPRIVATQEGRVILAKNDKAYVRGDLKGGTSFQVFRPGVPLKDPENNAVIGYEAVYLGTLKLERTAKTVDGVDSFVVASAKEEMAVGDRLMPVPPTPIQNYVPHAPEQEVRARIVSIYGGVSQAGQNQVVSINKGTNAGLNIGTVLELSRYGKIVQDKTDGKKPIRLPDEHYGNLFVFRVFENISYGLIMTVNDTVAVGDLATSPDK
ncbi:LysM peptidoglycan-binding domain-containing protein [Undibacterium sp. Jales W-56]|uniref:LysM peptidoglycan-binding domain-containing protein n=1 Tax=Undibacterium sp. Jales W-56 TaxID=2897325 RepID=UPI0021D00F65|nr:LysM peptidoglycan-binding domain-containing protein [Undibacterium sp. Jales W-56]MCU6434432.1 LysM peptidoglycan-binding domain-containing protein [Undibacterium sp. Jales W-56]